MEDLCIQMKMYLKDNGKMIRQTVMVFITIKVEPNIKAIGKMICNMEKEQKLGLIIQNLQVIMLNAKNMDKVLIIIMMALNTQEAGLIIILKVM